MTKHTKGTWYLSQSQYDSGLFGEHTGFNITAHGDDLTPSGRAICNITLNNAVGIPEEERRANAQFIAAAPIMFAACQQVVESFIAKHHYDALEVLGSDHPVRMCYDAIKDLI